MVQDVDEQPDQTPGTLSADQRRRRSAKLYNERLKLMATFFNGVAIATLVALIVIPAVGDGAGALTWSSILSGLFFAMLLHISAQIVLTFFRSEE